MTDLWVIAGWLRQTRKTLYPHLPRYSQEIPIKPALETNGNDKFLAENRPDVSKDDQPWRGLGTSLLHARATDGKWIMVGIDDAGLMESRVPHTFVSSAIPGFAWSRASDR